MTLAELPNIGIALSEKLMQAGILTPAELIAIGSKKAWQRLKRYDAEVCINTLMALEGAIQGVRWHHLSEDSKRELKQFYRQDDA